MNLTTYKGVSGYSYDAESRLVGIGTSYAAGYNGDGLRTVKTASGTTTYFLYDGTDLVGEFSAAGNAQRLVTWGANGLVLVFPTTVRSLIPAAFALA